MIENHYLDWITVFGYIGFTSLIIWVICFKQ